MIGQTEDKERLRQATAYYVETLLNKHWLNKLYIRLIITDEVPGYLGKGMCLTKPSRRNPRTNFTIFLPASCHPDKRLMVLAHQMIHVKQLIRANLAGTKLGKRVRKFIAEKWGPQSYKAIPYNERPLEQRCYAKMSYLVEDFKEHEWLTS